MGKYVSSSFLYAWNSSSYKKKKEKQGRDSSCSFFADGETVGPETTLWFRDTQYIRETDNLYGKRHHNPIHWEPPLSLRLQYKSLEWIAWVTLWFLASRLEKMTTKFLLLSL